MNIFNQLALARALLGFDLDRHHDNGRDDWPPEHHHQQEEAEGQNLLYFLCLLQLLKWRTEKVVTSQTRRLGASFPETVGKLEIKLFLSLCHSQSIR